MSIHVYKKGRTHIVDDLDCAIVTVESNEERESLLARGDHFDTVQEIDAPKEKPKRAKRGEKELVEAEETNESQDAANEDENSAD